MPELHSYNYAFIRIVPRVELAEYLNAGVVLFCRQLQYLDARIQFDEQKLKVFAPGLNPLQIQKQLDLIPKICQGGELAGPFNRLSQSERFHWLTSSKSTLIQPSKTHSGLTDNPQKTLEHIFSSMYFRR